MGFLSIFIKQQNIILFASFGGRKYDDSPKSLYEKMIGDKRFENFSFVWCFVDPNQYSIPIGQKVKIDSFSFMKMLVKSRIWISNSGMDRGVGFHRRKTIEIETWHGTPLKKICGEENLCKIKRKSRKKVDRKTIRCAQSPYDQKIFSRVFKCDIKNILLCDLPRNDELSHFDSTKINIIKNNLKLPNDKKVILYVPTYREYLVNEKKQNYFDMPINLAKWKKELSNNFILLVRFHYAVDKLLDLKNDGFVFDVSMYQSLNDLYEISDIVISDYSSVFFDFSILKRPMYCFAYDLEEYENKRGLYLSIKDDLGLEIYKDESLLINDLKNINYDYKYLESDKISKKFAPYAGKASEAIIETLIKKLKVG